MAQDRRGVGSIRTVARLLDGRKVRSPAGALLELSALANEKHRLQAELERWERRRKEIDDRLAEIAAKEAGLYAVVQPPAEVPVKPVPTIDSPPTNLQVRELRY